MWRAYAARTGNRYLLAATVALAAGITADVWVVALIDRRRVAARGARGPKA